VQDADDDAELLVDADGVRAVDPGLEADLAEELVEIGDLLLEAERERVVLRDDERAGECSGT